MKMKNERRSQGEGSGRVCTKNGSYCEKENKSRGGGGSGYANVEVKLL